MPQLRDEAVCIRHWDFSETSQTVSLFTREHGIIRGLAKGAKREKGKFSGGIGLLTRGQICAIVKPTRELDTLTEWDLQELFPALSRNLTSHYAALYGAELIQSLFNTHDPHPRLFDAFLVLLRALDNAGAAAPRETLRFQWAALVEAGYEPALDRDAETNAALHEGATVAFSALHGGLVADIGASDRWRVRIETVELLRAIASDRRAADSPSDQTATIDDVTVTRANRLLAAYVRAIIDREPATMRLLFGPLEV